MEIKDLSQIKLMPLRAVKFTRTSEGGNPYDIIYFLEKGSYFNFDEVTSNNNTGGVATLGYKFKAELKIPYNQFDSNGLLEAMANLQIGTYSMGATGNEVKLYLGEDYPSEEPLEGINSNSGVTLDLGTRCSVTYSLGTIDYRPQMTIKINGAYTVAEMLLLWE
jgi:hypothetical protein